MYPNLNQISPRSKYIYLILISLFKVPVPIYLEDEGVGLGERLKGG
jgi:hypothetical protein